MVRLRPVSITHPQHPVNVARQRAADTPGAVFADQFENLANLRAHLDTGEQGVCAALVLRRVRFWIDDACIYARAL